MSDAGTPPTGFGDFEPEDAWHPDDPVPVLIHNLFRRLALLERRAPRDLQENLKELEHRIRAINRTRHNLSERDKLRLEQLVQDTQFVQSMRL